MTSLILAACALACPLTMVGMMLFMRGHGRGSTERREQESKTE